MDYKRYLNSDEWKWKRDKRIAIDQKCAICGRPFDLQVHHITYENVPNENVTDLITVCRNCHIRIEGQKNHPGSSSQGIVNKMIAEQFCKEYQERDYSAMGDLDLCRLEVIKHYYYPFYKNHGGNLDMISGTQVIQCYFRNRRYEVILRYKENGAEPYIVLQQTKFSQQMVYKAYNKPQVVKNILEQEEF